MAEEREIKLRIEDLPGLQQSLAKLGARIAKPRVHEYNTIFDTPEFTLAKREHLLRIRTETLATTTRKSKSHCVVTFKKPILAAGRAGKSEGHKVRDELELGISDAKALAEIFEEQTGDVLVLCRGDGPAGQQVLGAQLFPVVPECPGLGACG